MPANWSPTPVRADGDYLTGSAYQADRLQAAAADVPQVQDDYSATLGEMQTVADPAPGGTPSLATTLAGELERLRYAIRQTKQALSPSLTQWYDVLPAVSLPTLPVPVSQGGTGATSVAGAQDALMVYSTTEVDALVGAAVPDDGVTDAKLRNSVGTSVIGRSADTTGDPGDIAAASDGQVLRRSGTTLAFGALNLASANAVTGVLPAANVTSRVPTGGATNALLAKTSAADYATAWTTTPTVADLTITGTLTSKHAVRAAAQVNAATGAIVIGFGFASGTRVSAGVYDLTLSAAASGGTPLSYACPWNQLVFISAHAVSATVIRVQTWNAAGTPSDAWFTIHVAYP